MIKKIYFLFKKKFFTPEKFAQSIGVKVGNGCYISTKKFSSEPYLITIGNNVRIATNVSFFTHGGIWPFRKEYPDLDYFGKINVGNNVYIGQDVKILPGVSIQDNCIVGAGSVLTKSIPEGSVVAGNPAKYIGKTNEFLKKVNEFNCHSKKFSPEQKKTHLLNLDEDRFIKKQFLSDRR